MDFRSLTNGLVFAACLRFLAGCGNNTSNLGTLHAYCDDAGNTSDVVSSDVPTNTRHRLTVVYTPDRQFFGITGLTLRTLPPGASLPVSEAFNQPPSNLPGGGYSAGQMSVQVNEDQVLLNIDWTFNTSGPDAGVNSAFGSLFTITTAGGPLSFIFLGQVRVTDELGRHWLGYPTVLDGQSAALLRFAPAERCDPGYTSRGDDTCVR